MYTKMFIGYNLAVINVHQTTSRVQFGYEPYHTLGKVNTGYGLAVTPECKVTNQSEIKTNPTYFSTIFEPLALPIDVDF